MNPRTTDTIRARVESVEIQLSTLLFTLAGQSSDHTIDRARILARIDTLELEFAELMDHLRDLLAME
jgi:hypothetical protein